MLHSGQLLPRDAIAAFTYTSRRGHTYHLCQVQAKAGGHRNVFMREPTGTPVPELPAGFEVVESLNGIVSLRRAGCSPIRAEEVEVVRREVGLDARLRDYRVDAQGRAVVVFEPLTDIPELAKGFGIPEARLRANMEVRMQYQPVLRFVLADTETRTFRAERWCFRGSVDDWLDLHDVNHLDRLAGKYVKHLRKESFFELY